MAFYWKFTRSGKFSRSYISLILDATPDAVRRQKMIWQTSFEEVGMCLMLLQDVEVKNVPTLGPTKPAFRDVVRSLGYEPSVEYREKRNEFKLVKGKSTMGRHDGEALDWGYYSNRLTPIDIDISSLQVGVFIDAKTGKLYGSEDKLSCFRSDPNFRSEGFYFDLMPKHVVMIPMVKGLLAADAARANAFPMVKGLLAADAARANAFFEKHLKWKKLV